MEGYTYKTTALALQNRRLVTVSKKGGVWRAEVTPTGQHYLQHGQYPDASVRTPADRSTSPPLRPSTRSEPPAARSADGGGSQTQPGSRPAKKPKAAKPKLVTEQLVADVIEAGGELHVQQHFNSRPNWEHRVSLANHLGKVPEGKLLTIERGETYWKKIIRLQDAPEWMVAELAPIEVPESLRKPHPIVAELRSADSRLSVTSAVKNRALRLIQALLTEAEKRGYVVASLEDTPHNRHLTNQPTGLFTVACLGHAIGVDVRQATDTRPHVPSVSEQRRAEREPWYKIPKHDHVPTERLQIGVTNGQEHRQWWWSDGQQEAPGLEEWLPQILQEIELRARFAEEQRLEKERREAERQRQWEAAMARAKHRLTESHRSDQLLDELKRWRQCRQLREYIAAMEQKMQTVDDDDARSAAADWIAWATSYVTQIDPLNRSLSPPSDPEPTPSALEPFLDGWSPYGPDRRSVFR